MAQTDRNTEQTRFCVLTAAVLLCLPLYSCVHSYPARRTREGQVHALEAPGAPPEGSWGRCSRVSLQICCFCCSVAPGQQEGTEPRTAGSGPMGRGHRAQALQPDTGWNARPAVWCPRVSATSSAKGLQVVALAPWGAVRVAELRQARLTEASGTRGLSTWRGPLLAVPGEWPRGRLCGAQQFCLQGCLLRKW